ncbi:MAG TPA: prephenate dehydratase [Thermoanaerobaculia bacterium]|jgi:prephenate dehydratase|nr:prephenate dehydratase [Thermoanaerobaculia bacterium]
MMITVAFQGERGAFSEEAARKLLGDSVEAVPCRTFEDAFAAVVDGRVRSALIPIENSLAGSVLRNYELLAEDNLSIRGEVFLRISHHLIAPPDVRLEEIRHVYSHPVALAQCQRFISEHDFEAVAAYDTAGAVKDVMTTGAGDAGAIAGRMAAELYGGAIVASDIEDHPENYTRFLLLSKPEDKIAVAGGALKTSLLFRTPNRPGALFRALAAFALRDVNMTKIESRPIVGRPWEYSFYVDINGDTADPNIVRAIDHLREMCEVVRVLGCYPSGT